MPEYIDGPDAADTMLAFGTWRSGYCLEACWQAYKRVGASTGMHSLTALDASTKSGPMRSGTPPKGVPVWFGIKRSNGKTDGDIGISVGGGKAAFTDGAGIGRIGIMTIDARSRQIDRPYLGWTENIFDQKIEYEGRDMPLSDADIEKVAAKTVKKLLATHAGQKDAEHLEYGTVSNLLGLTAMRAGKAATRATAVLAILQGSGADVDIDTAAILAALRDLPANVIAELKEAL